MRRRNRRRRRSLLWPWVVAGLLVLGALLYTEIFVVIGLAALCIVGLLFGVYLWWKRRKNYKLHVKTLGELLALSPAGFELEIAALLRNLGYKDVTRTGRSGDLMADITCRDPDGRSVVVQCKRYAPGARINSPSIQALIGMATVQHKADRAIFVTTAEFTTPAIELARQHRITLHDGKDLTRLIHQVHNRGLRTSNEDT